MRWYYTVGGTVYGPIGTSQLLEMVQQQSLAPDTSIWRNGMPRWRPANEVAVEEDWNFPSEGS